MTRAPEMGPGHEFELIARLAKRLGGESGPAGSHAEAVVGIGDDAAVTAPKGATATSTDAFVEGVHFRRDAAGPRAIGRKALAAALSDLAAMGARAGEAYVAIGLPEDMSEQECVELYEGLGELAERSGTAVLGGDVTRAPVLMIAVTVVGHAESAGALVARDGATPGEAVVVTGELGGAAAGLLLIDRPELEAGLATETAAALRERQLTPEPRLAAGAALASSGASAMIDLSDGLGADAGHIAAASGVRLVIELDRLPIQEGVAELAAAAGIDPGELATSAGEDYELIAALPPDHLATASAACPAGLRLTEVGSVVPGAGVEIRAPDGSTRPAAGFDHLADRRAPDAPG